MQLNETENFLEQGGFLAIGEQNPRIKQIRALLQNTKPNPDRLFVAEGIFYQKRILQFGAPVSAVILCPELIRTEEALETAGRISGVCPHRFTVSQKVFEKISERDKPDGLLSVAALPRFEAEAFKPSEKSIVLVLDGVEIPGNIGTMIRMADGAGLDAVMICNRRARLTHPKLIKGSQGAVLSVPIYEFESAGALQKFLYEKGFTVYLADTRAAHHYYQEPFGQKTAVVMGSERYGITRGWYEGEVTMISIPMLGQIDSLNVGVAATVLCYEASVKNKLGGR